MAEQLHFLIVPLMSQSHIIPLTGFSKSLAQHGVLVSIITTPLNALKYKEAINQARAQKLNIQMIPIRFPNQETGLPDGCENMDALKSLELSMKFFQACEMLQAPLEDLMQDLEPKPACIVSSNALPWTQKVAWKFKIPRYIFETLSCFSLLCSHNLSIQETAVSDSEPFLVPNIPHKIEFTKAQLPKYTTNGSDGFAQVIDQIKQSRDSAEGTLVNSFQDLEPWYMEGLKKERGKVWCIGPVSLSNGTGNNASIDEHYSLTWLDSMKPKSVIYACFGSLCNIPLPQLVEIGLGLESSNIPFIWIIRKQDQSTLVDKWLTDEKFQERVRGRGLVVHGWAPQVPILSHRSIGGFLTHCGWNSTLEGVCAGVPMITWPMFAEQFYNEKFIVNVLRIGVSVGAEGLSMNFGQSEGLVKCDQVRNAVEELMEESEEGNERRRRAEELAKLASNAVEESGSSYLNVAMLIEDVMKQVDQ